ncbi:hypothetical protein DAPPUDRAFT_312589 [Daphnia pulex]|uniref:Uncharacterized protein n=1 Tax=Daphnia pulex TaxID=6669 RepID=E9FZK1_DAPPU|nr:hypothetical protein DAPPUDRAFT_312589 [Daphnia pulex]|eukprot:EFX87253.1 hypothetical protein DAPPUDRAFT_312589 [Daphnia pulex]
MVNIEVDIKNTIDNEKLCPLSSAPFKLVTPIPSNVNLLKERPVCMSFILEGHGDQYAEYYTTTFAAPVYYTEKPKYFSAPSNYRTEAPVDYTIYAPGFYSTPYAAPIYTTKAHTTKSPELLLRLLRPSAPKLRSIPLPRVTTPSASKSPECYFTTYASPVYYIMVKPEMETVEYKSAEIRIFSESRNFGKVPCNSMFFVMAVSTSV